MIILELLNLIIPTQNTTIMDDMDVLYNWLQIRHTVPWNLHCILLLTDTIFQYHSNFYVFFVAYAVFLHNYFQDTRCEAKQVDDIN